MILFYLFIAAFSRERGEVPHHGNSCGHSWSVLVLEKKEEAVW